MKPIRRGLNLLRLGVRTIRGREGAAAPALATVAGVAFATFVTLALLSAFGAVEGYRNRVVGREPIESLSEVDGKVRRSTIPVDGETLTVFAVAGDASAPPGLARLPRPGEIYTSPELIARSRYDPRLSAFTEGRRVLVIETDGLAYPSELVAWVGVEPAAMPEGSGFSSYGNENILPPELHEPGWMVLFAASAAILVLVPLWLLAAASGRVNAGLRERRLVALRVLGLSRLRTSLIPLIEVGVLAGFGSLLGGVVHWGMLSMVGEGPLFGRTFFSQDVSLPWPTILTVAGAVTVVTIVAGFLPTVRSIAETTSTRPSLQVRPARRWPMLLLVGSLVSLLGIGSVPKSWVPSARVGALYLAGAGFMVGLVGGLGALVGWLAARGASSARRPETLVASRRLETNPGSATRYLLGFAVVVFGAISTGTFLAAAVDDPAFTERIRALQTEGGRRLVRVENIPPGGDLRRMSTVEGVEAVVPLLDVFHPQTGEPVGQMLLAGCDDLRRLARVALDRCPDEAAMINVPDQAGFSGEQIPGLVTPESVTVRTIEDDELQVAVSAEPIELGLTELDPFGGDILVDPAQLGVDASAFSVESYVVSLEPDPQALERFRIRTAAAFPMARIFVPGEAGIDGTRALDGVSQYLTVLMVVGAGLVLASVAVVGLQLVADRRTRALLAIGTPRNTLWRVEFLMLMFPASVGLTVAVAGGLAFGAAVARTLDAKVAVGRPLLVYLAALLAAGSVAAVGGLRVMRADPADVGSRD